MKLFEKRFQKRASYEYGISSDHPRTVALALPGFVVLIGLAIASFIAIFIFPDRELLFFGGFFLCILAAIGWMFFALHYGKRHYEKPGRPTATKTRTHGTEKGS